MGMIQTTLIGNIDAEPKLFTTANGYDILTIRVKVETRKKAKGQFQDFKSWHTVKIFGDRCKELQAAGVGDLFMARGELQRNKWTNKEGQEQINYEIVADYAELLEKPEAKSPGRENGFSSYDDNEEVPF
tara:strand:- start:1222 stop:1611 length:390 start_codon:yes stop_codon:yes gene_type:complete